MTWRRIEYERLCFEQTLLLVRRKGSMGEAGFTLANAAVSYVWVLRNVGRREKRGEERGGQLMNVYKKKGKEVSMDWMPADPNLISLRVIGNNAPMLNTIHTRSHLSHLSH